MIVWKWPVTSAAGTTALVIACALSGCADRPVELRAAPLPTPQEMAQIRAAQTRTLAMAPSAVFPGILEVLMDAGYIVRSADRELGLVTFYQQWNDPRQGDANIVQEGSAVFRAAGPGRTQVRVVLTGGWQRLELTGSGPRSFDTGMVAGVQQHSTPAEYTRLLDLIEHGLAPGG